MRASGAALGVKLAFEFLVLTAARSGEVRGARWAEIDTDDHVWTIPVTRTKAKRDHRVPLCGRALEILNAARSLDDGNALVFPSVRGKRMNDMALSALLRTLTRRHVERMVGGLARKQRNRVLAFTSRVFRQFEQWEWREQNTNPARGVERARETPRDRTLAPSELAALARALDDMAGAYPASVAAIRFAAVTGLRIGEVLAIRWEDVDLEQSRLTMPETKTGRRQHDLRAAALAILRELMRVNDCPWAFTTTGRAGLSYRPVRVHFGEAVRAAGLADVRLHDLRRTVNDASGGGWSRNARSP